MSDLSQPLYIEQPPVSLLLAGPQDRVIVWYQRFMVDARFRVAYLAHDPQDLVSKLSGNPEVVLLDAALLPDLDDLGGLLTRLQGAAYVLLPPLDEARRAALEKILLGMPAVKGLYYGDVNLSELSKKILSDNQAQRRQRLPGPPAAENGRRAPLSLQVIAVWNQMGGVGKTTLSSNLAYAAAQAGIPTLLVGLGAPDDLPLVLGLNDRPNINTWRNTPTAEGLKQSIQKLDTLDVVAGFPDVLSELQAVNTPLDGPDSLQNLVYKAAFSGYAAIIFDAPPSALAASAIHAANTLLMVARPSLEGVLRSVEAYKTIAEKLKDRHEIADSRIFVALNRVQNGHRLDADSWHRGASQQLKRSFPPIIAEIAEDPRIGDAQDYQKLPLHASPDFANSIQGLLPILLGTTSQPQNRKSRRVLQFGPLKVKV